MLFSKFNVKSIALRRMGPEETNIGLQKLYVFLTSPSPFYFSQAKQITIVLQYIRIYKNILNIAFNCILSSSL